MFKKILIANRGEIAVRVARACHELGISTIGIYSTVDAASRHLWHMDDAVCIGDPAPQSSYLNILKIIEVAQKYGAQAIHPGYGFLAENARFVKTCEDAGIAFIGPNSKAMALVGDKIASRNTVRNADVPIIPGMEARSTDLIAFRKMATQVGYPVIVKASMGGGGKGMRIVRSDQELESNIAAGQREAQSAFGDATVYLEKYIEKPRHIEFQVIRDTHGNVVHLYERECSIQRRHQKIIEETPSPALEESMRSKMGEVAKRVIEAANYTNAGTVEFLVDENKKFYFLEVNARVQVEHPITEMVTGVDLVRQQILVAAGEKLNFTQKDICQRGHAVESRIYAEDPDNDFMPSPGRILYMLEPSGPGIRVDSGIYQGWDVPPHYDPILSKLIAWAETREAALNRISHVLEEYIILGIKTNIGFLKRIMDSEKFITGDYHTHFIDDNEKDLMPKHDKIHQALIAASLIKKTKKTRTKTPDISRSSEYTVVTTPWQELGHWEICR
ncbi:MAG: acetyl-CoA carboxylase biotin carboxylase subunit [bacterium]